jgi:hypothetical protein
VQSVDELADDFGFVLWLGFTASSSCGFGTLDALDLGAEVPKAEGNTISQGQVMKTNAIPHKKLEADTDLPPALRTETLSKGGWVDRGFATQWLEQHWKHRACPICHESEWGMLEQLVQMPVGARVPVAPQEYPCVLIACRHCGHTLLFSAVRMGVVPSNVYLVSRGEMREVAAASAKGTLWWILAAAAAGLGVAFSISGIMTRTSLNISRDLVFEFLPLGFFIVFAIALVAIFIQRRHRKWLLAVIEEESKVPTESQIEPSEITLN